MIIEDNHSIHGRLAVGFNESPARLVLEIQGSGADALECLEVDLIPGFCGLDLFRGYAQQNRWRRAAGSGGRSIG